MDNMLYHTNDNVRSDEQKEHLEQSQKNLLVKYFIHDTLVLLYAIICFLIIFSCAYVAFGVEQEEGKEGHKISLKNETVTSLDLSEDQILYSIDFVRFFPALKEINLSWSSVGDNYQYLKILPNLIKLNMHGCQITTTKYLKDFKKLQNLIIRVPDIEEAAKYIKQMTSLRKLTISGDNHRHLEEIGGITQLKSLSLRHMFNQVGTEKIDFPDLSFLLKINELTKLNLSNNDDLYFIAPLSNLKKLQILNLSGCHNIKDLAEIAKAPALKKIDLRYVRKIDIPTLPYDIEKIQSSRTIEEIILN